MISWELGIKTSFAISSDDVEEIKQLLYKDSYPNLKQAQKEDLIFSMVHTSFNGEQEGKKIMNYLIFDYKISESVAIKSVTHDLNSEGLSKEVQKMFDTRKFHSELKNSLDSNTHKKKAVKL